MSDDKSPMVLSGEDPFESNGNGTNSKIEKSPEKEVNGKSTKVDSSSSKDNVEVKLLKELKVADLKLELDKRGLATSGVKAVLAKRLRKHLEDDGKDPDTYDFNSNLEDNTEEKIETVEPMDENKDEVVEEKIETVKPMDESKDEVVEEKNQPEKVDVKSDSKDNEKSSEQKIETEEKIETVEPMDEDKDKVAEEKIEKDKIHVKDDSKDESSEQKIETFNVIDSDDEIVKHEIKGTIFQFNAKVILFEFTIPVYDQDQGLTKDEDHIGAIKPEDLELDLKGKSIPSKVTDEDISQYIQAGDELKCEVFEKDDLEEFKYDEDEEEIGEDGSITKSCREIVIQPKWNALKGHLITDDSNDNKKSTKNDMKSDDVLNLDDQIMLDYEPEEEEDEEEESEDVLLIEDVNIDDNASVFSDKATEKEDSKSKDSKSKDSKSKDTKSNDSKSKDLNRSLDLREKIQAARSVSKKASDEGIELIKAVPKNTTAVSTKRKSIEAPKAPVQKVDTKPKSEDVEESYFQKARLVQVRFSEIVEIVV